MQPSPSASIKAQGSSRASKGRGLESGLRTVDLKRKVLLLMTALAAFVLAAVILRIAAIPHVAVDENLESLTAPFVEPEQPKLDAQRCVGWHVGERSLGVCAPSEGAIAAEHGPEVCAYRRGVGCRC